MSEPSETAGPPVALIVEDDEDTTALLEVVLTQAGFSVLTADNGADGIELARTHHPTLATIDVTMPQMDGLEATRRIREFSDAYIVIISGKSQEHDILAGFDAGADDYVPKPIRPVELRARLAAVARRPVAGIIEAAPTWAPADVDSARSAFLQRVVAGQPIDTSSTDGVDQEEDEEDTGQDGREGMLEVGMRFVGGWIEFRGLRINPARGIVVVDDRLADLPQEQIDLLEILMYAGSRTLNGRQLALRLRGQTEETATTTSVQDQRWVEALVTGLRVQIKDDEASPRWLETLPNGRYRLVRPDLSGDDATA
ncbi:response regulator [Nocardioides sp. URHA0020]|uniref:response regulator n=1 Tax=Nocardioides sp. URHA0020 TaxID=1380392 RepID=UPI00048F3C8E|nr:response regulator [Nocardioides sp. URHA0020]